MQDTNTSQALGWVLGTTPATTTSFKFLIAPGVEVQINDLVMVKRKRLDTEEEQVFYGVVDAVEAMHEGVQFDTDVIDVVGQNRLSRLSRTAMVNVNRLDPEFFVPPLPGDEVHMAAKTDLEMALATDRMDLHFPAGLLSNGHPLPLNLEYIDGTKGAHINISGISGIATKTSYALYLLYAMRQGLTVKEGSDMSGYRDEHLGHYRTLIFNVKGEDLLFLDKRNARFEEKGGPETFSALDMSPAPFENIRFIAPPRKGAAADEVGSPDVNTRMDGVESFAYSLREFCLGDLLPFTFSDADKAEMLEAVVETVTQRLKELAQRSGQEAGSGLMVDDWLNEEQLAKLNAQRKSKRKGGEEEDAEDIFAQPRHIKNYGELIDYVEYKLLGQPDKTWVQNQQSNTIASFMRRFKKTQRHMSVLVRGDVAPEKLAKYAPNITSGEHKTVVVDISKLETPAQAFVIGAMMKEIFKDREKDSSRGRHFIMLDELNKYAPRSGGGRIKGMLLDIAERGRSLGIILVGAQQTASEVEERIVGNAAVRVVGRLDAAEAQNPEYKFLGKGARDRVILLQPGTMYVHQPDLPNPMQVTAPFPAWATRKTEVAAEAPEATGSGGGIGITVDDSDELPF